MLTIGSRGSKLALWQANHIRQALEECGHPCRIEIIKTSGDQRTDVSLKEVGNKGVFTKELEEALIAGTIDLAVHSLKDMATELPPGLQIAAIPQRQDVRDVLIGKGLEQLRQGARIGTGSVRRAAQLRAVRQDLDIQLIRGNVDTRLQKLDDGLYDAIVLAAAGLNRLGLEERISQHIPVEIMCPAVGQGALAIETRVEGPGPEASMALDDAAAHSAITAERAVLEQLGGGCEVPIGAYACIEGEAMWLRAVVAAPDGSRIIRQELRGHIKNAEQLGAAMAARLLDAGAGELLARAAPNHIHG